MTGPALLLIAMMHLPQSSPLPSASERIETRAVPAQTCFTPADTTIERTLAPGLVDY